MNLSELIRKENLRAIDVVKKSGAPKSSISTHLKYERGQGGRPVGLKLAMQIVRAFPELTLEDLRADLAEIIAE